MEEADQLCDRLAIIDHGRLLAIDTPAELKRSVAADALVTVQADGDTAALGRVLDDALDQVSRVEVADDGTLRLWCSTTDGLLPRIIDLAEEHGHAVHDLSSNPPTLETVFISLTGKDLRE